MTPAFDRRFTPARPDLAAESLRGVIDAPRYVAPRAMRVVEPCVALSRAPQRDIPIDTQALFGETVDVYEIDEEGWVWGQLRGDGYVGYMPAEALRAQSGSLARAPTHSVRTLRTLVYPGPDMKLPHVNALPLGAHACIESERGDFALVAGVGYVWRAHLVAGDAFESDFVAVAERFLHAPYLWGCKTSDGVDCSGLVQLALAACGLSSPRDTDVMEQGVGAAVACDASLDGLRRGDLVFWKGHVGVMRDAQELLHANGHSMLVASEPLRVARDRIAARTDGAITSVRRL